MSHPQQDFLLNQWRVKPSELTLCNATGDAFRISPRNMAVLQCLTKYAGQVVSRDTFGEEVWAPAVVTDDSLNRCIAELRKVLGDKKGPDRIIETIPKRGYKMVGSVTVVEMETGADPAASSTSTVRHNLPTPRSSFIGRERELKRLLGLLDRHPLVTLTGVGGTGKTRLALALAQQMLSTSSPGIFFVDLSAVREETLLPQALAAALGLALSGLQANSARRAIFDFLERHPAILIIDNCEHLLEVCATLADELLQHCPSLQIIATSREALGIEGEQIFRVPSLSLPGDNQDDLDSEAIRLFVERASEVNSTFKLDASNSTLVRDLCSRLDGIPLAIELAAARTDHLSLADITDRLHDRFRLLTGGHRHRAQRQQTLQAAVDWSFELLSPYEQKVLARLSVFSDGFTLEAAEGVCMRDIPNDASAIDLIGSLAAKSLVVTSSDTLGRSRFKMLETIRLYGANRLIEWNESEAIRTFHRDWFVKWVRKHSYDYLMYQYEALVLVDIDLENFKAALNWSDSLQDLNEMVELTIALSAVWTWLKEHEVGYLHLRRLSQHPGISAEQRAKCLALAGVLAQINGEWALVSEFSSQSLATDPDGPLSPIAMACMAATPAPPWDWVYRPQAFDRAIAAANDLGHAHQVCWILAMQLDIALATQQPLSELIAMAKASGSDNLPPSISRFSIYLFLCNAYYMAGNLEGLTQQIQSFGQFIIKPGNRLYYQALARVLDHDLKTARQIMVEGAQAEISEPIPLGATKYAMGFAELCWQEGNTDRAIQLLASIFNSAEIQPFPFRIAGESAFLQFQMERLERCENLAPLGAEYSLSAGWTIDAALQDEIERSLIINNC